MKYGYFAESLTVLCFCVQAMLVPTQAMLVRTQATVSTVTTLTDNSTQEAKPLLAQVEASGPAWGREDCWDIFLVAKG